MSQVVGWPIEVVWGTQSVAVRVCMLHRQAQAAYSAEMETRGDGDREAEAED